MKNDGRKQLIGDGVGDPYWGSMVHEGQSLLFSNPLIATLPRPGDHDGRGGETFLGDFLRDLLDPRLKSEQLGARRASAEPDDT